MLAASEGDVGGGWRESIVGLYKTQSPFVWNGYLFIYSIHGSHNFTMKIIYIFKFNDIIFINIYVKLTNLNFKIESLLSTVINLMHNFKTNIRSNLSCKSKTESNINI